MHDPPLTCWPFVSGRFGTVAQKLMKLFFDVALATWPAAGVCCPSFSKPVCTRDGSRQSESCRSPEAVEEAAAVVAVLLDFDFFVEVVVAVAVSLEDATVEEAASLLEPESSPVSASVAPVAAIREFTSACVVHVMLVPALFTRGNAAQLYEK